MAGAPPADVVLGAALAAAALAVLAAGYLGYVLRVLPRYRVGGTLHVTGPDGQALGHVALPARREVMIGGAHAPGAVLRLPWLPGTAAVLRVRTELDAAGGPWRVGLRAWRVGPAASSHVEAVWPHHLYVPRHGPLPRQRVELDGSARFAAAGLTFEYRGPEGAPAAEPIVVDLLSDLGARAAAVPAGPRPDDGDGAEAAPPLLGRAAEVGAGLLAACVAAAGRAGAACGARLAAAAAWCGRRARAAASFGLRAGARARRGLPRLGAAALRAAGTGMLAAARWSGRGLWALARGAGSAARADLLELLRLGAGAAAAAGRALLSAAAGLAGALLAALAAAGRWLADDLLRGLDFDLAPEPPPAAAVELWQARASRPRSGADLLGFLPGERR